MGDRQALPPFSSPPELLTSGCIVVRLGMEECLRTEYSTPLRVTKLASKLD